VHALRGAHCGPEARLSAAHRRTSSAAAHAALPLQAIPLGGCKVDLVDRGPKAARFGLRITHPDFYAGRMLILAAESADEQKAWLETLNDCSRV